MSTREFVGGLHREILEGNLDRYREILQKALEGEVFRDPYWRKTAVLYQSLSEDQRRQIIAVAVQVPLKNLPM